MKNETVRVNSNSSIEFHDYAEDDVRIRINAFDNNIVLKEKTFKKMIEIYKVMQYGKRKQSRKSKKSS